MSITLVQKNKSKGIMTWYARVPDPHKKSSIHFFSLGDSMDIGSTGDKVGRYLSVVNSHDGSNSMKLLVTPYRFFCQNQISKAINRATREHSIISIRHDARGQGRLKEIAAALRYADGLFASSEVAYQRLADRRITMEGDDFLVRRF